MFKDTLLQQIKDYLDGKISKEEYYDIAENYYTANANRDFNFEFQKCFIENVANACLYYIDEPGLTDAEKEKYFYEAMSKAYLELQKL